MNENKFNLIGISGALAGVGFSKIDSDIVLAGILIGSAVVIQFLVGIFKKFDIPVSARVDG